MYLHIYFFFQLSTVNEKCIGFSLVELLLMVCYIVKKMKAEPDLEVGNGDHPVQITGDVIGDTAYSERFVLKILLKLANRDTLQEEIKEPTFEEELCTLWDMTAERDVVLYLQTHDTLNLFYYALPVIETQRIIEIIIGTIANMCCQKEAVNSLIANKDLLLLLLEFLNTDDSQTLNQLLRMTSSCLYVADEQDISTWIDIFEAVEYPQAIYFILQNSSNKELLMTALENLNAICVTCKIDGLNEKFSSLFETPDALTVLYTAHREYSNQASSDENLERLHIITLQMMLHLQRHELLKSGQSINETSITNGDSNANCMNLIKDILISYESKMKECFKIDVEFLNVLEAATVYIQYLELSPACTPDKYFNPCYKMWKVLIPNGKQRESEILQFMDDIKDALALLMCLYLSKCSNDVLLDVLDNISDDYGHIVSQINDVDLQARVANRALNYRNRLNESVDS